MPLLAAVLAVTAALCFGAWKLGRRSGVWSVVFSLLLMFAAWRVLLAPAIPQGEGAAAGVVVVQAAIWYVGAVSALLAFILLGTSFYVRRSILTGGLLLCVVAPTTLMLSYRLANPRHATPTVHDEPARDSVARRDSYLEGYTWAVDNGIGTAAGCVGGKPAFVEGCKKAAERH